MQWRARLADEPFATQPERLRAPAGCAQCRNSGYFGRATIAELLVMNDQLQRLVCDAAPDSTLEAAARSAGMTTMYQCGMSKAWRGETSVDEVLRVTRMD
jgi:general secretion pathway protein E